jgi:hypothetical protein
VADLVGLECGEVSVVGLKGGGEWDVGCHVLSSFLLN